VSGPGCAAASRHYPETAGTAVLCALSEAPTTAAGGAYVRRGEGPDRVVDSTGLTRGREIARLERNAAESARTAPRDEWFRTVFTFAVPYGTYTLLVEVTDSDPSAPPPTGRDGAGSPVRCRDSGTAMPSYRCPSPAGRPGYPPHPNYGGDVLFGSVVSLYAGTPPGITGRLTVDVRCDSR